MKKEPVVVAVSGGFDPIHVGHIRHFKDARALGDRLVVILNNDEFLLRKKGYVFMPLHERKELIESIEYVDEVVVCDDPVRDDVSYMLERMPVHIYAKGGDRRAREDTREADACDALGIEMVFGVGGTDKPQSSSWLAEKVAKQISADDKLRA